MAYGEEMKSKGTLVVDAPTPIETAKWLLYKHLRKNSLIGSPLSVIRYINKSFGHKTNQETLLNLLGKYGA